MMDGPLRRFVAGGLASVGVRQGVICQTFRTWRIHDMASSRVATTSTSASSGPMVRN
jgi:hypothetical protein